MRYTATTLLILCLTACGPTLPPPGEGFADEFRDAPPWVKNGCAAFEEESEPVICGVGSMGGTRNISLARSSSVARARTDLARTLQVKVKAMIKDYQAATGDMNAVGDEQHVVDVSKQITKTNLAGTRVEQTWVSPNRTLWTLVVLDVESFKGTLDKMEQLDERVRKAIIERAEEAFRDLDKELEKSK